MNLTIHSALRRIQPAQRHGFNTNHVSVEDLDRFPHLKHVENIADSVSQPLQPPLPWIEKYPGVTALLCE